MKKSLLMIMTFLFISFFAGLSFAQETIRLTSNNWEPYASEKLPDFGFTSELIASAFEMAGYPTEFRFYPWKRAMRLTMNGKCDALYSAYYSEDRAATYAISEPYIHSNVYLATRKGRYIRFKSLVDLSEYRIGVVLGYTNSPEFDRADYLQKDKAMNDLQNLKKLMADRVDLIVIDRYVAIHHLKTSPYLIENAGDIRFLEPPLHSSPVHVMFSKAVPGHEKRLIDFNRGLKLMKEEGKYDRIMQKHGYMDAEEVQ